MFYNRNVLLGDYFCVNMSIYSNMSLTSPENTEKWEKSYIQSPLKMNFQTYQL